ncbi:MAG: PilZ domain-containing protein [Vulcanimicrobiota bacterium]
MKHEPLSSTFQLSNRRQSPRVHVNLDLTQDGFPSQSINLSADGIRFVTRHEVAPTVHLTLKVGDELLHLKGQTRWSQRLGDCRVVGALFEAGQDLPKLKAFLKEAS